MIKNGVLIYELEPYALQSVIEINRIATIFYFEFNNTFVSQPEKHDFWEMVYVDKGAIIDQVNGTDIHLKQGGYIIIEPNAVHSLRSNENYNPNVFIITFTCGSPAMDYLRNRSGQLPDSLSDSISSIIREAHQTFDNKQKGLLTCVEPMRNEIFGGQQMIKCQLEQLLIRLYRNLNSINEYPEQYSLSAVIFTNNALVNKCLFYIRASVYNSISLRKICERFGYSESYISALFKKHTDYTVTDYINQIKMQEARILIRENRSRITEIAELLCYEDVRYFSRVFKKFSGMSPSEYKKLVKKGTSLLSPTPESIGKQQTELKDGSGRSGEFDF